MKQEKCQYLVKESGDIMGRQMKKSSIIGLSFLLIFMFGCKREEKKVEKTQIQVQIQIEINKYTPAMSSAPGILMKPVVKMEKAIENVKYHWITEYGVLLSRVDSTGEIKIFGKDTVNSGEKIYWSIDPDEPTNKLPFKVFLKLEDLNTGKVLGETNIEINENKDNIFEVNK